jgi:hypothetical protein
VDRVIEFLYRPAFFFIKKGIKLPGSELLLKFVENSYLFDLLSSLKINCVIDVGANKGQYAQKLRRLGYSGHIFSFEPIVADYEHMLNEQSGDALWHIYNVALGSANEERKFNVIKFAHDEGTVLSSFLSPIESFESG